MQNFSVLILLLLVAACGGRTEKYSQENMVIGSKGKWEKSTTAGNLITSAMRSVHNLDIVLYPTEFLRENSAGRFTSQNKKQDIDNMMAIYPQGGRDQFRIGYMNGRDLKIFVRQRTLERFKVDFEVAGISYDIMLKGGMVVSEQYGFENGNIDDERIYSVAISDYFIRPGNVFPPYKFRNSIERMFDETNKVFSAREALQTFLDNGGVVPLLSLPRARVKQAEAQDRGAMPINKIQGENFLSPYYGDKVTTIGIVTGSAKVEDAPGGHIAYIQTETPDDDPATSEGIKLFFEESPEFVVGDKIEVTGIIYEEMSNPTDGLTTTAIREIKEVKILSSGNALPAAVALDDIPREYTTFVGNLNLKPRLNVKDAIDYWESFEGMRTKIKNPKVMGFRGGRETYADDKRHLTLYVIPETRTTNRLMTDMGGVYTKPDKHIMNPDMVTIASGPLTNAFNVNTYFNVGDTIGGEIEGIVTYTKNLFGEGEYLFQIPSKTDEIRAFEDSKKDARFIELDQRPKLEGELTEDSLVIASYNIKNLSSIDDPEVRDRLRKTGEMIHENMSCPDILGLVEIQDNNGEDFSEGSEAEKTIQDLINYIPKKGPCENVDYQSININPLSHREGGVPGANIRVALIYNKNRVGFKENPAPNVRTEPFIQPDGHLNYNPGRVAPNSEAFRGVRKSIVAEFTFKGEPVFVIVNHFNSKIADTSHFSIHQPVVRNTEIKRSKLSEEIRNFVSLIEKKNSKAHVAVVGDFNAYVNELPMKVLEGDVLYNLIRDLPRNEWYTTNHNGNSQSLDYIFVNKKLQSKLRSFQIPQVNSDFMGRLSDHDPVISIFDF